MNEIIKIFNDKQQDYFKTKLKYRFKAKNSNINSVSNLSKKSTIYQIKSLLICRNFMEVQNIGMQEVFC